MNPATLVERGICCSFGEARRFIATMNNNDELLEKFIARRFISKNTLEMIDSSMKSFARDIVSEPVDTNETRKVADSLTEYGRKAKKTRLIWPNLE